MVGYEAGSAAVVLLGTIAPLVRLWLLLRYRLQQEQERRRYLLAAGSRLPFGSRVREQRVDGTRVIVTIGAAPGNES